MHGHTTELVTNLLLPGWFDLRSVARAKSGEAPLNSIDIIDGDDYDRCEAVDRLRSAMQHPDLRQLVLSEIELDEHVIGALFDLLRSGSEWEAVYLEFCSGDLDKTLQAMTALDNVKRLEVAGNINYQCIQRLSHGLTTNTSLVELSLLVSLDEIKATTLIDGLEANTMLRSLKLIGSTLLPESIKPLTDYFRRDSKLEIIHIDGCIIQNSDIAELVSSLKDHPSLRELYIDGNTSEENIRAALSDLILQNTLSKLSLRSRKDVTRDSKFETSWLVPALKENKSLEILDLADNGIDDDGLISLVQVFVFNTTLQEVRLHDNHITNKGAEVFGRSIPEMNGLRRIFLHRNRFEEAGANQILEGVRINHQIEELTVPTMGRSRNMSRYQRLISYETCLNSGGKHLLRHEEFPLNLWPIIFERAGNQLWTPYCEYQMQSIAKWKKAQQADVIFYLIQNCSMFGR